MNTMVKKENPVYMDIMYNPYCRVYHLDALIESPFNKNPLKKYIWSVNPEIIKNSVKVIITDRSSKDKLLTWASVIKAEFNNVHTIIFDNEQFTNHSDWVFDMLENYHVRYYYDSNYERLCDIQKMQKEFESNTTTLRMIGERNDGKNTFREL